MVWKIVSKKTKHCHNSNAIKVVFELIEANRDQFSEKKNHEKISSVKHIK